LTILHIVALYISHLPFLLIQFVLNYYNSLWVLDTTSVFYCQSSQCTFSYWRWFFSLWWNCTVLSCHRDGTRLVLVVLDYYNNNNCLSWWVKISKISLRLKIARAARISISKVIDWRSSNSIFGSCCQ